MHDATSASLHHDLWKKFMDQYFEQMQSELARCAEADPSRHDELQQCWERLPVTDRVLLLQYGRLLCAEGVSAGLASDVRFTTKMHTEMLSVEQARQRQARGT